MDIATVSKFLAMCGLLYIKTLENYPSALNSQIGNLTNVQILKCCNKNGHGTVAFNQYLTINLLVYVTISWAWVTLGCLGVVS